MVTTTTGYPVVLQGGQLSVPSVQGGNPYIYHSAQEASSVQGAIPIAFGAQGAAFACSKDGMAPSEYSNTHYTNTSNYKHWFTTSFWRKVPETDVRSVPTPTSTHSRPRSATAILTTPTQPVYTHSRPRSATAILTTPTQPVYTHSRPRSATAILTTPTQPVYTHSRPRSATAILTTTTQPVPTPGRDQPQQYLLHPHPPVPTPGRDLTLAGASRSIVWTESFHKYRFLSRQKYACRDKSFVATKLRLLRQNFCRDKYLSRWI